MAIDVGWAHAPDALQGARGLLRDDMLLYSFPNAQLGVKSVDIGSDVVDEQRRFDIIECHVHVRNDEPNTVHVTWTIQPEAGKQAKYWQWFSCVPGGAATSAGSAGAAKFVAANPDLRLHWLETEEAQLDAIARLDEFTEPYAIMLATELAATMTPADSTHPQAPDDPTKVSGVPLGWAYARFNISGAQAELRGSDAVWAFAPPAAAGGYPVQSCALWLSPEAPWACQISYRLTAAPLAIDVTHWYTINADASTTYASESLSADGSQAPAGAVAASAALRTTSDAIAAAAAANIRQA